MKFLIAFIACALFSTACAAITTKKPAKGAPTFDPAVYKMIVNDANSFNGTVDAFKAAVKQKIANDPNQYTLDECNKFLDEVCKLWKATFMKCSEFKDFVIAEKRAAGKIKP